MKKISMEIDPICINGIGLRYLIRRRKYFYVSLSIVELIFGVIGVIFGFLFGNFSVGGILGFIIGLPIGILVGLRIKKQMRKVTSTSL